MDTPEKSPKGAKRENSACGRDAMHRVCMLRRKKFFKKGEGWEKGSEKGVEEEKGIKTQKRLKTERRVDFRRQITLCPAEESHEF